MHINHAGQNLIINYYFGLPARFICERCRSLYSDTDSMTELKKVLEKSLIDDSCMSITIHCNIPKLTLRINDSRQMTMYGIGLDRQQGFTLSVDIDRNSNKGKKLREKLNEGNSMTDFKAFEGKRSILYLKDFKLEIDLIEETIHDLLRNFDVGNSGQTYHLTANRTDGNFTIE
jgi:hypothetical protein